MKSVLRHAVVTLPKGGGYTAEQFRPDYVDNPKKTKKHLLNFYVRLKDEEYEQTKYFRPNIQSKSMVILN